jgi:hypothetical protein
MDELTSILLSIQDRMEELINQIESGALCVTEAGAAPAGGSQNHLRALREQRDDLDKAIALARNPEKKVY